MKQLGRLAVVMVLLCTFTITSFAGNSSMKDYNYTGFAYSILFEEIGELSNIKLSETKSGLKISFDIDKIEYSYNCVESMNSLDTELEYKVYSFIDEGEVCEIYINGEKISGRVTVTNNLNALIDNSTFNFIIMSNSSKDLKTLGELKEAIEDNDNYIKAQEINKKTVESLKTKNENEKNIKSMEILGLNTEKNIVTRSITTGEVHVAAASWNTAPLPLISGASAEGWINYNDPGIPYNYSLGLYNFRYSVFYNLPTDGITLWYSNASKAAGTPMFPQPFVQTLSGSWTIDKRTGSFMAEATATAFFQGFPIMLTTYDNIDFDSL